MSEPLAFVIATVSIFSIAGSAFALGMVLICRALKWHPINVTINLHNHIETEQ